MINDADLLDYADLPPGLQSTIVEWERLETAAGTSRITILSEIARVILMHREGLIVAEVRH